MLDPTKTHLHLGHEGMHHHPEKRGSHDSDGPHAHQPPAPPLATPSVGIDQPKMA